MLGGHCVHVDASGKMERETEVVSTGEPSGSRAMETHLEQGGGVTIVNWGWT